LNVLPLDVPPLRERRSDISQIAMFYLDYFSRKTGKKVDAVLPETMERLVNYAWPGNVRELRNVIERGVVLSPSSVLALGPSLFSLEKPQTPPSAIDSGRVPTPDSPAQLGRGARAEDAEGWTRETSPVGASSLEEVERRHILTVLEQTGWKISGPQGAARILKLHPNTLRDRMTKLGITRPAHGNP
jgi:formate hydrogenlyase transcriptional activator